LLALRRISVIIRNRVLTIFFFFVFIHCNHEITPGQIAEGPQLIDENAVITGTVKIKEGLIPKGTGTLFIITRLKGEGGGPPLAVKRVEDPVFPIGFQMSQANVMIKGNRFRGEVTLTAKWSRQGSPMVVASGDLSTTSRRDVMVGTRELEIILDHEEP
jgi:cytochrome c-type biogenesis protein CcmH